MSSSDCQTLREHLSAYHDGELSARMAAVVQQHVESCGECAAELKSFETLSSAIDADPVAPPQANLWQRIERDLSASIQPASRSHRIHHWVKESPYRTVLVSLAASVLLLLGAGLWYGTSDHGMKPMGHEGSMSMHAGHGEDGMSAEHRKQFAGVMASYLRQLPSDPDGAEQMLLSEYSGQRVDAEGAVKLVGYQPLVSGGLPEGYSLASTSVLQMPCCTCVKAVCKRTDGSTLVLFEHDDEETAWFGDRPSSMATCGDKDCCLVDLDSSIAATWKQGSRSVTAVGVRDQSEVATLVNWLNRS